MTEIDGKATGWRGFFREGSWQIEEKPAARPKRAKKVIKKKTTKKKIAKKKKNATSVTDSAASD